MHLLPGEGVRTVIRASAPNNSSECQLFLESLGIVFEVTPDGDFNTHTGNDSMTWRGVIGRNGLPNLVLSWIIWQGRIKDGPKQIVRVCRERLAEYPLRIVYNTHLQESADAMPVCCGLKKKG